MQPVTDAQIAFVDEFCFGPRAIPESEMSDEQILADPASGSILLFVVMEEVSRAKLGDAAALIPLVLTSFFSQAGIGTTIETITRFSTLEEKPSYGALSEVAQRMIDTLWQCSRFFTENPKILRSDTIKFTRAVLQQAKSVDSLLPKIVTE